MVALSELGEHVFQDLIREDASPEALPGVDELAAHIGSRGLHAGP